jgi:hypothetical protein
MNDLELMDDIIMRTWCFIPLVLQESNEELSAITRGLEFHEIDFTNNDPDLHLQVSLFYSRYVSYKCILISLNLDYGLLIEHDTQLRNDMLSPIIQ